MRRPAAICVVSCALTLCGMAPPSDASDSGASWVRSESPALRSAIARARGRSATFRQLLQWLDNSDGLIYLIEGQCPRGVGACLHHSMEIAGSRRLLRISVNPRWFSACDMTGAVAHELQHAKETLAERNVRRTIDVYRLFERIGPTGSGTFETQDALDIGAAVARETCGRKGR